MASVYVTRQIPEIGINLLRAAGHEVEVSKKDGVLTTDELKAELTKKEYDAVLCLLTDTVNGEVFDIAPTAKIFANYAVGYNNINVPAAHERGVTITNTPGVLTDTVAEYAFSLMLAVMKRIPEADRFTRAGKYDGWAPEMLLGSDLKGKTLGILGAGRIGSGVAIRAQKGFGMRVVYYDIKPNKELEKEIECEYRESVDDVLKEADVVSVHVPLLDSTKHLINAERLSMMKSTAYLINTSRGPVIDEKALVDALKNKVIRAAGLDVYEDEPALAPGLTECENVVITPHIASASEETRGKMSEIAAQNIIDFLAGSTPQNVVEQA
jgi:lactate dehydrogenase-like 2-hydroxyacid dehydrogenase